jgi:hypothetical protein
VIGIVVRTPDGILGEVTFDLYRGKIKGKKQSAYAKKSKKSVAMA